MINLLPYSLRNMMNVVKRFRGKEIEERKRGRKEKKVKLTESEGVSCAIEKQSRRRARRTTG